MDLFNKYVQIFEYCHCDPMGANQDPSVRVQQWAEMAQSPLPSAPPSSSCTSNFLLLLPAQQTRVLCSSFKLHS